MQHFEKLDYGKTYHIYNKGINGENIFRHPDHYSKFLWLYEKYIDPVANTYAWCLLGNHFHLLIQIKEREKIKICYGDEETAQRQFDKNLISRQFSHFFNAYSQSFNTHTNRTGGLFHTPFKRKPVEESEYFTSLVYYIHHNPVKHGFCERIQEYPWSSYSSIINIGPLKMESERIIGFFDGKANFIAFHNGKREPVNISHLVVEEP